MGTKSEGVEVTVRVAEVKSAERLEVAADAADRGDFDGARGGLQVVIDDLKQKAERPPEPQAAQADHRVRRGPRRVQKARSSASGRKEYSKKFKAKAYSTRKK